MVLDFSKSPLIGEMSAGQRGFIDITVFVCLVNLLNCYRVISERVRGRLESLRNWEKIFKIYQQGLPTKNCERPNFIKILKNIKLFIEFGCLYSVRVLKQSFKKIQKFLKKF